MSVEDIEVKGKRVIARLTSYVTAGQKERNITDDKRIVAALPTIRYLIRNGRKTSCLSHLGRSKGRL
jgi:3-phosphoglycerate kinase